jgi:serine/threonine protein kinase
MGLVYKAYDAELDRRVAIKMFHRDRGGEADSRGREIHARAMREAQALAKLSHPNIVAVHEVGSYEGQVYIVMEYVLGETLREWLAARPPLKRVLEVFVQIGQALAAAHRAGDRAPRPEAGERGGPQRWARAGARLRAGADDRGGGGRRARRDRADALVGAARQPAEHHVDLAGGT